MCQNLQNRPHRPVGYKSLLVMIYWNSATGQTWTNRQHLGKNVANNSSTVTSLRDFLIFFPSRIRVPFSESEFQSLKCEITNTTEKYFVYIRIFWISHLYSYVCIYIYICIIYIYIYSFIYSFHQNIQNSEYKTQCDLISNYIISSDGTNHHEFWILFIFQHNNIEKTKNMSRKSSQKHSHQKRQRRHRCRCRLRLSPTSHWVCCRRTGNDKFFGGRNQWEFQDPTDGGTN